MSIKDELKAKGTFTFQLVDKETGEVEEEKTVENAIVDDGRNNILSGIGNLGGGDSFVYLAVGTDGTSVTDGDSSLGTEVERIPLDDASNQYSQDTANTEVTGTWTFGTGQANSTLAEAGLFTASSGGTMLNRTVISPTIGKSSSQELRVTWTLSIN